MFVSDIAFMYYEIYKNHNPENIMFQINQPLDLVIPPEQETQSIKELARRDDNRKQGLKELTQFLEEEGFYAEEAGEVKQ